MLFEFATAARIVFGPGVLSQAGRLAREHGSRALVVTGRDSLRARRLLDLLAEAGVATTVLAVSGEPSTSEVERGATLARSAECDCVVGFGGGSALDAAKAISVLQTNGGPLADYLEVIGRAQALGRPGLPCLAIPTTAGTGAEVTRNAVLFSPLHRVKVSLRSPYLLPRIALVDPDLTHDLPPPITASTGLDALTQLIEPFTSSRAQPVTDALCRDGLQRAARALPAAFADGRNSGAREDMALASLFGGLALANAGLGAVHGFAGPLGGMFPAPHGAVCAALLAPVMRANVAALRARAPHSPALARYDEVARLVTGSSRAIADDGIRWVAELVTAVGIRPLAAFGVARSDFEAVIEAAARASSMKANAIALSANELEEILAAAV